jgi:hypothetical protein
MGLRNTNINLYLIYQFHEEHAKTTKETFMSKAQENFAKSVASIAAKRSTGSTVLDQLGSKVLYGIKEGKLAFTETESGYEGKMGKASITVGLVPKGKVNRTVLNVAGTEIQGEFAARAYKMAHASLNKKGRKAVEVDEAQVADVMSLLD